MQPGVFRRRSAVRQVDGYLYANYVPAVATGPDLAAEASREAMFDEFVLGFETSGYEAGERRLIELGEFHALLFDVIVTQDKIEHEFDCIVLLDSITGDLYSFMFLRLDSESDPEHELLLEQLEARTIGENADIHELEEPENVTTSMQNARSQAQSYIGFMPFSRLGLVKQLEYEGFANADALYAVDRIGADWKEQAVKKAKDYLGIMAFSYSGLYEQLIYEQFTDEEAAYGVDNSDADWKEQAVRKAREYLDIMAFSYSGLIQQLQYEGFTAEEAGFGADNCGANW